MDIVLRESERLNDTIRSFLAYARPQRAAFVDVDVRRVLTDAARAAGEQRRGGRRASRSWSMRPAEPVVYRADEAQIRQIVWNLATNGLRAMPNGGELRLSVRRENARRQRSGSTW